MAWLIPLHGTSTSAYLIGSVISGYLYALVLGYLLERTRLVLLGRIFASWLAMYVIQMLNPLVEGFLFTDQFTDSTMLAGAVIFSAVLTLIYAVAAGFLFKGLEADVTLRADLGRFFSVRKGEFWVKFMLAAISWAIIYFVFGSIVGPYVLPFYTDPDSAYHLVLPDTLTLFWIQAFRGLLYLVSLLPLLASVDTDRRGFFIALAGLMYVGGGLSIFVIVDVYPLFLRAVHGLEMLADSVTFAGSIIYLLSD
jgi:hypothetical protein